MKQVATLTVRPFDRFAADCQVLSATESRSIIIQSPDRHPNVDPTALTTGRLRPFGIFPLIDSHRKARWTVHVERENAAPIAEYEAELVNRLCSSAMEAWEAAHNRFLEQQWVQRMIGYSARTLPSARTQEEVLRDFIRFLEYHEIVKRGRIFKDLDSVQTCVAHFGAYPIQTRMDGYQLRDLSSTSQEVLAKLRQKHGEPLFVVQHSGTGRDGPRGEFTVFADPDATYMAEFGKSGLTEWIEAGVYLGDTMHWKVVLDHKGRHLDRFSLSEMRLVSHMVRTLSWAVTRIDSEQLRSYFCIDGAIRALKRHQLRNHMDRIGQTLIQKYLGKLEKAMGGDFPWRRPTTMVFWVLNKVMKRRITKELGRVKSSVLGEFSRDVRQIEDDLGPFEEQGSHDQATQFERCSDVFRHVQSFIAPYCGPIQIKYPDWAACDPPLQGHGLALCLIMLIVLQNAVEATHSEPLRIDVRFDPALQTIRVRDWGDGLPQGVIDAFKLPPAVPDRPGRRGLGLVLARFLAGELDWDLRPVDGLDKGTEFILYMNGLEANMGMEVRP